MRSADSDPTLHRSGEPVDDGRGLHERQLLAIVDALPTLVAYVDAEQRYRFVNGAYVRWFGRSTAEIVGKHLEEVLGREAYRTIRPHAERALAGEPTTYESDVPYRLGGSRSIEATYIPQRAEDGSITGFVSFVADISERRSFERFRSATEERGQRLLKITAALAEAVTPEEVFAAVVDHVAAAVGASSVGLWIVDEAGTTMRLVRSVGYADAAREHLAVVPLDAVGRMPAVDAILRGAPIWIASQQQLFEDYPHLRAIASPSRSYRITCLPLVVRERKLGVLGLTIEEARDVSDDERSFSMLVARYASQGLERLRLLEAERRSRDEALEAARRAEQHLAEQQETLRYNETFAGILAHDLRNPLGAMMTAAHVLLRRQEGEGDKVIKPLSRIVSSGERMARMIEQLLDFTRVRVGGGIDVHPQASDLADLCVHVMDELELVHPEWVLQREVSGDTSGAWDPDRLLQVISNLLTNAGLHGKPEAGVRVRVDGTSPAQVCLEIHNEGAIPETLLPSIFDPFRGTHHRRDTGRGLGLGLYITQQIVQAHGGTIELRSTEIEGTTFVVRLPRHAAPSRKPTPPPIATPPAIPSQQS